jgi:hypothetical protein
MHRGRVVAGQEAIAQDLKQPEGCDGKERKRSAGIEWGTKARGALDAYLALPTCSCTNQDSTISQSASSIRCKQDRKGRIHSHEDGSDQNVHRLTVAAIMQRGHPCQHLPGKRVYFFPLGRRAKRGKKKWWTHPSSGFRNEYAVKTLLKLPMPSSPWNPLYSGNDLYKSFSISSVAGVTTPLLSSRICW